jgi:hypothetical protein
VSGERCQKAVLRLRRGASGELCVRFSARTLVVLLGRCEPRTARDPTCQSNACRGARSGARCLPQEKTNDCADARTDASEYATDCRRASGVAGEETSPRVGDTLECLVPYPEPKTNDGAEQDGMPSRPISLVHGLSVAVGLSLR